MKTSNLPSLTLAAVILASAASDRVLAAAVNVDIQGNVANTAGWFGTQGTYSSQGVPTTGSTWNGVTAGNFQVSGPLVDDQGNATSISMWSEITAQGGAWAYAGAGHAGDPLMTDYGFHTSADPNLFTLFTPDGSTTGLQLSAGSSWDIYIYSQGDAAGQGGTFNLAQVGGDITLASAGNQISAGQWNGSFVENGSYVVFRNVSPTAYAGGLEFKFLMDGNGTNGDGPAIINGIQLVQVPEPTTAMALLGSFGLMALVRRRG